MKTLFLASTCLLVLSAQPASARDNGFGAGLLGGVLGGVIGGAITQPRPPPPVYAPPVYIAPPPVIYERRVYVAPPPVYVPPTPRLASHPWPGPGFACYEPEPNAVNRTICNSEDLSAAALSVQQAFYAAIQQTPYSAGALRGEYTGFLQSERVSCAPYGYQQQVDCLSGMLARERDVVTGRLTGIYAEEAARPVAIHVELQQRLRAMGLLVGAADGVYGDGTRRAISSWQAAQRRSTTGVLTDEEVATLIPGYGAPPPIMNVASPPAIFPAPAIPAPAIQAPAIPAPAIQAPAIQAPLIQAPVIQASVSQPAPPANPPAAPLAATPAAVTDAVGGMREGMPYGLARAKLFAAGWQTQYFSSADLSDQDRDARQWFIDHHIAEVQDCSSSGCKLQFHNNDGRLLYVYTQVGSHASDAYRGAGPSVIAYCIDQDDITCSSPQPGIVPTAQQANK